jgi:hypothetical protein
LRALGQCIRCGGRVAFSDRASAPRDSALDPKLGPHQVMGAPRLDF